MKALENFNDKLNDVSVLNEYSFSELYPWYYFDTTDKLKKDIITSLTGLPQKQFAAFLKYIQEQIQVFHVFDPEVCIIQKWLDKFNLAIEEFPFFNNQDIELLTLPRYKDYTFEKEQSRIVYSIQREFHLHAVFLEVQKIQAFINELLINEHNDSKELGTIPATLKEELKYKESAWFKIGLLFATGEMEDLLSKFNFNGTQIAEYLGNKQGFRPYITESIGINKSTSEKSVFSNISKMNKIILHCEQNNIKVVSSFFELLPPDL
jgi:hypothetical protein